MIEDVVDLCRRHPEAPCRAFGETDPTWRCSECGSICFPMTPQQVMDKLLEHGIPPQLHDTIFRKIRRSWPAEE